MIENALEEDPQEEFRGGSLRIGDNRHESPRHAGIVEKEASVDSNAQNCHWRNAFMAPLSSIPNKITETIWSSSKPKEEIAATTAPTPQLNEKCVQLPSGLKNDPNNYFTFREGVIEKAVKECVAQFLDIETEGPLHAYFLLTQINHWDTDKERLILITNKHLVLVKYDFIALRRLGCRKIAFDDIDGIVVGNLVYPSGSLIPKINGFADGVNHILESCLFRKLANSETEEVEYSSTRVRNMKGIRLLLRQEKPDNFTSKWNPFNDDVPYVTFTFHPLYFHKDCTEERQRNFFNLEIFIDHVCLAVTKCKENSVILQHNILLENYIGIGSIIHNRHSLGFFKVRGKFSF